MFIDKVKILIQAGNGGDGCVSFRREKYVPDGGPDGGDGGNGGNIVFQADKDMRTLIDFRFKTKFVAPSGEKGRASNMRGPSGTDLLIKVPLGTVVKDFESGRVAADIRNFTPRTLLVGGAGGKGNARFATSVRRSPNFATPGATRTGVWITLELKTIADVGLIGFPNVGKSTLLSMTTAAHPKIANYHFTTLEPNLGVVAAHGFSFIMADIPGLFEGASQGAGLGHEFLRHIERTRMLAHILDISGSEGRDPLDDYDKIRAELAAYSDVLSDKEEIIVANKMDIGGAKENLERLKEKLPDREIFSISCATGEGIKQLVDYLTTKVKGLPETELPEEEGVIEEWQLKDALHFEAYHEDDVFYVEGSAVDAIFKRIDPDDEQSMKHFQKLLIDFGIIKRLKELGAKDGDTIRLNDMEFEFYE